MSSGHIIRLLWDMMKPWERELTLQGKYHILQTGNKYELVFDNQFME